MDKRFLNGFHKIQPYMKGRCGKYPELYVYLHDGVVLVVLDETPLKLLEIEDSISLVPRPGDITEKK